MAMDDGDGSSRQRVAWCERACAELAEAARQYGLDVDAVWGDDGEPEMFVTWPGCGLFHGRVILGEEDDGSRFGFYTTGEQGRGGSTHVGLDMSGAWVGVVVKAMHEFRARVGR